MNKVLQAHLIAIAVILGVLLLTGLIMYADQHNALMPLVWTCGIIGAYIFIYWFVKNIVL